MFLNEVDFIEQINGDLIEKLRCAKQRLVNKFEDFKVCKLIYVLIIIDSENVSFITIEIEDLVEKNTPYEKEFFLFSFKHFIENANVV